MCEGAKSLVPKLRKASVYVEELAWWFTWQKIGEGLRERYDVPKELPPNLQKLVKKLDDRDWLLPRIGWSNDRD
jgi:hypothetical protein